MRILHNLVHEAIARRKAWEDDPNKGMWNQRPPKPMPMTDYYVAVAMGWFMAAGTGILLSEP